MLISTRALLALVLPLATALFVWAELVLRLWVGSELLPAAPIFRAFLVFAVFASLQESPLTLLYGVGQIRFSAGLSVAVLMAALGLGAWACSRSGPWGLAIVYALLQVVGTRLLCGQALKLVELNLRRWLKKAVVPVLLAELPVVAWFLISYQMLPHTLAGLAISVTVGLVLFLGLFARLATGPETRTWQSRVKSLLVEIE